jgi:hypothetical protein
MCLSRRAPARQADDADMVPAARRSLEPEPVRTCGEKTALAVRLKVKAGREQQFLDAHNKIAAEWTGLLRANIFRTGEDTFCIIAEWTDMDAIAGAQASMIATLDSFRDTLADLGDGRGVTDAISGPAVKTLK